MAEIHNIQWKVSGVMFYEHDRGNGGGGGNSINVLQIFSVFCFVQCILVSNLWRSLILRLYFQQKCWKSLVKIVLYMQIQNKGKRMEERVSIEI